MSLSFAPHILFFALLGGVLPVLIWLWFWLQEDKKRPEPRGRIIATFLSGMLAVAVVLPLEKIVQDHIAQSLFVLILLWALIEEVIKLGFAWYAGLRHKSMNEPVDAIIYLITAALGFAALENALFLFSEAQSGILTVVATGNMRFIGATLVHTLASGLIGAAIAFSYYRKKVIKREYLIGGVILATGLHALFNYFIIKTNEQIFVVFAVIWLAVIGLLVLFEKAKRITPQHKKP